MMRLEASVTLVPVVIGDGQWFHSRHQLPLAPFEQHESVPPWVGSSSRRRAAGALSHAYTDAKLIPRGN